MPHDATSSEHQQKCVEKNQEEISFTISVPLSFFTDEAVSSLDVLEGYKELTVLCLAITHTLAYMYVYVVLHLICRMGAC